jgi:ammonia channel protein AmtB
MAWTSTYLAGRHLKLHAPRLRMHAQISIGCVRARFAKHIAILVLVDACASALGYYITGYAFSYGDNQDAEGFDNGACISLFWLTSCMH